MSLTFLGPSGDHEERWITFALLRDNVVHHLDPGRSDPGLAVLYRVTEALGGRRVLLDAAQLRAAAERAERQLRSLPISQLAISSLTQAVLGQVWPAPQQLSTRLVERWEDLADTTAGAMTLGDVFGSLLTALEELTRGELPSGAQVEVIDS
jgi:hypothetical protein